MAGKQLRAFAFTSKARQYSKEATLGLYGADSQLCTSTSKTRQYSKETILGLYGAGSQLCASLGVALGQQ